MVEQQFQAPPLELLNTSIAVSDDVTEELKSNAYIIIDTLKSFGAQTRITDISRGPIFTRYELLPSVGVRISKITGLAGEIALNLSSANVNIAPIAGKAAIGVDVPNKVASIVNIRDVIMSPEFEQTETSIPIALGKDIAGNPVVADIEKMSHLLIAGVTGSGKSMCIHSIIISLLYKASFADVKLLMIDPKVVELSIYSGIPHLLIPVVTDPKKATGALSWVVADMLKRYKIFEENQVRDFAGYNRLAKEHEELAPMPKIIIIIDELADIMITAPVEAEDSLFRLSQLGRAAGIHIIITTHQIKKNVITDMIKTNIPSRISFAVSTPADSRTILNVDGAEKLIGHGDMLFYPVASGGAVRVQGSFVTDAEVEKVVDFIKSEIAAKYDPQIAEEIDRHVASDKSSPKDGGDFDVEDEMLPQAIECVVETGMASTSQLQRRLKLGYARAARIIDQLEERGIVGPFEGSKPRQVLISKERWVEMKLNEGCDMLYDHTTNNESPHLDIEDDSSDKMLEEQSSKWIQQGLCKYCGGQIGGLFKKKCKSCGQLNRD